MESKAVLTVATTFEKTAIKRTVPVMIITLFNLSFLSVIFNFPQLLLLTLTLI